MSESSELTGPLVKMIRQMGILVERMNSGRVKVRGGWMQLHSAGTADVLCFPRGRVVWIEIKDARGHTNKEQVEAQAAFRDRVLEIGHEYFRITSIDQGLEAVRGKKQ